MNYDEICRIVKDLINKSRQKNKGKVAAIINQSYNHYHQHHQHHLTEHLNMEINTQSNDDIDTLLKQLTPTQEHFLKKYLLEEQLSKELHNFNEPNCCQLLGYPFKSSSNKNNQNDELSSKLPLLSFFSNNFNYIPIYYQ